MDYDIKVCTKFKLGMHEYSEIKKRWYLFERFNVEKNTKKKCGR